MHETYSIQRNHEIFHGYLRIALLHKEKKLLSHPLDQFLLEFRIKLFLKSSVAKFSRLVLIKSLL